MGIILKNPLITYRRHPPLGREDLQKSKVVTNIDKRKSIILLSVVAVAAMLSSYALTAYASDNGEESPPIPEFCGRGLGWRSGIGLRGGCFGWVEVSEDYEANAIAIAESDGDVQNLLTEDYSISGVRPIIKSIVDADGDVEIKATRAIVVLKKENATGHASVMVDLETSSVTKIVIVTRTVIDKT